MFNSAHLELGRYFTISFAFVWVENRQFDLDRSSEGRATHSEIFVVEAIVSLIFEEISVSILPLECGVNIRWDSFPDHRYFLGVATANRHLRSRVVSPILVALQSQKNRTLVSLVSHVLRPLNFSDSRFRSLTDEHCAPFLYLEEVSFAVATPHESSVDIIGDAGESDGYFLWVSSCRDFILEAPIETAFEEECFSVGPRQSGVDAVWQAGPIIADFPRISRNDALRF